MLSNYLTRIEVVDKSQICGSATLTASQVSFPTISGQASRGGLSPVNSPDTDTAAGKLNMIDDSANLGRFCGS
jgi:hypothetical protein